MKSLRESKESRYSQKSQETALVKDGMQGFQKSMSHYWLENIM